MREGLVAHLFLVHVILPNELDGARECIEPDPYGRYGTGIGNEDVPMRDIGAIYGNLPDPDPPDGLDQRLIAQLIAR